MAAPSDRIVGRYAHDFVLPQTEAVSDEQLRAIAHTPEARSDGLAHIGAGRTVLLEYIAVAVAAGDEVQVWLRDLGGPAEVE